MMYNTSGLFYIEIVLINIASKAINNFTNAFLTLFNFS